MSDLRTGLVEAIARMLIDDPHCDDATNQKVWDELAFTVKDGTYEKAEAIVDRTLGFLTDNAEAPIRVEWLDADIPLTELATSALVAVLSGHHEMSGLHENPCGLCGRQPALGFASIGDHWYCHDAATPSCYEQMQHRLAFADRSWDGLTGEEAAAEEATWD